MGIDANYQALPDNCALIEKAKHDSLYGWYLDLVPYWFAEQARASTATIRRPTRRRDRVRNTRVEQTPSTELRRQRDYENLVQEVIRANPGIENRSCIDGTRAWDALHYLLSAERRRGYMYTYGDDIGSKAMMGSQNIAPHLCGGQVGAGPTRFLPSAEVIEVAAHFELTQSDDLRWWYDLEKMVKQGVYKVYTPEGSEATWDWIIQFYLRLRACYLAAAAHGEGMLVTFV